jgi:large subunit ribosomal protein L4
MPSVSVLDTAGNKVGTMKLKDEIFGIEPNKYAMHMAVVNYLANQRQGTQSTLTRSEVSGGGKKPWRQKGTGRARQGSTRSPQWTHGGIALGPKPRDYRFTLNKKVRRLALQSALSDKAATKDLIVIDALELENIKTAEMVKILTALGCTGKTLIVIPEKNDVIVKSARNIEGTKTALVNTINTYDIINSDKMVIVKSAVKQIEEVYA